MDNFYVSVLCACIIMLQLQTARDLERIESLEEIFAETTLLCKQVKEITAKNNYVLKCIGVDDED